MTTLAPVKLCACRLSPVAASGPAAEAGKCNACYEIGEYALDAYKRYRAELADKLDAAWDRYTTSTTEEERKAAEQDILHYRTEIITPKLGESLL
jgi:hypothetical protein